MLNISFLSIINFYRKKILNQLNTIIRNNSLVLIFQKLFYQNKLKNHPKYLFNKGVQYYLEEKFNLALDYFKADLKFNKKLEDMENIHFFFIGKILLVLRKRRKAVKYFKKQISFLERNKIIFKNHDIFAFYLYSLIYLKRFYKGYKLNYLSLLKIKNYSDYFYEKNCANKNLVSYHQFLISLLKGRYQEALAYIFPISEKDFSIRKDLFQVQKLEFIENILFCYAKKKRFKKILKTLSFKFSKKFFIYLYQIFAYYSIKKYEQAKNLLHEFIKNYSIKNSKVYFNLGNLYFLLKRYNTANHFYSQAIFINPKFYIAYFNLAILHHKSNLIEIAENLYLKTIQIIQNEHPTKKIRQIHSKIFFNLGFLYYQQLNYKKSIHFYIKSYEIYPSIYCLHNIQTIKLLQILNKNFDKIPIIKNIQKVTFFFILLIFLILLLIIL